VKEIVKKTMEGTWCAWTIPRQLSTQEINPENTVTETSSTTEKSPKSTEKQEQDQSSEM